jgi:hypothetical protein
MKIYQAIYIINIIYQNKIIIKKLRNKKIAENTFKLKNKLILIFALLPLRAI